MEEIKYPEITKKISTPIKPPPSDLARCDKKERIIPRKLEVHRCLGDNFEAYED